MNKKLIRDVCPPFIWRTLARIKRGSTPLTPSDPLLKTESPDKQDLDLYWDEEMARLLDEWGEGNVWNEIQLLMASCKGKILDIACGTGRTAEILSKFSNVKVYGCDISDLLIKKALDRGISHDRLKVCDATKSGYLDEEFDYSYSIGSLEHFTEQGIVDFVRESHRITRHGSFHMVPTSRTGKEEGWIKTVQSYFNNGEEWWLERFRTYYPFVYAVPSKWEDSISVGRWFICLKDQNVPRSVPR